MDNPWLHIPLDDYEGHMNLPHVGQATMLADVFEAALRRLRPRSVAVLGCAGGNGFERIDPAATPRVVGVDINPAYIDAARGRFEGRFESLELYAADIQADALAAAPVELIYAGLLFEYVEPVRALERMRELLAPAGVLMSVVQLPSAAIPEVTPTPFGSLDVLAGAIRLVPPESLRDAAVLSGLREFAAEHVRAAGGKSFVVQSFRGAL